MPPLPKIRVGALLDLIEQLRYTPREALKRDIARAEALAGEIDPGLTYPEDWVVFRVTGYRPDMDEPANIVGDALRADLSALVERLSDLASLSADDIGGETVSLDELAERWNVSHKTIERYRKRGLVAHRVSDENGRTRLAFRAETVERFEREQEGRISAAGRFTRIPPDVELEMIRRAEEERRSHDRSLSDAASVIARETGRSHEAVRQVLQRHDRESDRPIFDDPPTLSARDKRAIHRAMRRGIEPSQIAERFRRSRASIIRLYNEHRAELLRSLDLDAPVGADFRKADARSTLLGREPVREVPMGGVPTNVAQVLIAAKEAPVPIGVEESTRAIAYCYLRAETKGLVETLTTSAPDAKVIDECETMLRWAARLKGALLRAQLPVVVRTVREQLPLEIERLPTERAGRILTDAIDAAGSAIDHFDPFKGGRLAAPVGLAVHKLAAERAKEIVPTPGRARPLTRDRMAASVPDFTLRACPWQAWLEPDPRIGTVLTSLEESDAMLLADRFALRGHPPHTLREIAERLDLPRMHAAQRLRVALRRAIERARKLDSAS